MKKIINIAIIVFCYNGFVFSQTSSNIRKDTTFFKNDEYCIETYQNDTLVRRLCFDNDSTKKIEYVGVYGCGGVYKLWYKNGNLKIEGIKIYDKKVGVWTFWNENGQRIYTKDFYSNETKVLATYYTYYETGVLKSIKKYKGKATRIKKYPSIPGSYSIIENEEKNLTRTGEWIYFSEMGNIVKRNIYK